VLGRDATSVFPTESRRVATAESAALAELLGGGNKRFISETEVGVLGRSCWVELTGSAVWLGDWAGAGRLGCILLC
jgi:hypothetical protein